MNEIITISMAILPVIFFIAVGYSLKHIDFFQDIGWEALEKLTYYILFPALIIHELWTARFNNTEFLNAAIALNVAQLIMFFISFLAWAQPGMNGPKFTSIVQNNIRWNSYVVLGVITALYPNYIPIAVLAIASMMPTANILSVWALLFWGKPDEGKALNPITGLFKNPLIIACIIGGIMQYFKTAPISPFYESTDMLGAAAMPLGLLAVGAGINVGSMRHNSFSRIFWAVIRLIGLPIATYISCLLFGVYESDIMIVVLLTTSAPTATNAYILARQLGGDAPFMAALVGTTTLFSVITIPLIIFLYKTFVI